MTKYYTCHGVHFMMRNHQFVDLHEIYLWYSKDSLLADLQQNGFTIDQSDNIVNMPQVQQPTITKKTQKTPKAKQQGYVPQTLPSLKTVSNGWGYFDTVTPIDVSKIIERKYLVEKQNIHGDTIGFIEDADTKNTYYIGKMDNVKKAKTKDIKTIDEFSNIDLFSSENFENTGVKIGKVSEFILSSVDSKDSNLYFSEIEPSKYMFFCTNRTVAICWELNIDTLKKRQYVFPIHISSYKNQYVYILANEYGDDFCCNQSYNTFTIGKNYPVPNLKSVIKNTIFDRTVEYSVDDMKRLLAESKEIQKIFKEIKKINKHQKITIVIEPILKLLMVYLPNMEDSLKDIINDLGLFEDVSGYYVTEKYKNIKLDLFGVLNFQYIEPFFIEYGDTDCTVQIPKIHNQPFLFTSSTFGEPDTNYIVMPFRAF